MTVVAPQPLIARRKLVLGLAGLGGVSLLGCRGRSSSEASDKEAASLKDPKAASRAMTVYRDPSCGCCEAWAAEAQGAGYKVSLIDRPDMPAIKTRLGVPGELASCHTAVVGGYVLEGHVPMEDVGRLLTTMPKSFRGLAVAGMPRGSPGMEMPDGSKDRFNVMAFDHAGKSTLFRAVPA